MLASLRFPALMLPASIDWPRVPTFLFEGHWCPCHSQDISQETEAITLTVTSYHQAQLDRMKLCFSYKENSYSQHVRLSNPELIKKCPAPVNYVINDPFPSPEFDDHQFTT